MKTFLNPLSTSEERAYLEAMAAGDQAAKGKLIEHNMRLVAHVAKKYYNESDDMEDLISIGTIGLLKAVETYNPARGSKLATYAARCIDNELLMYFRSKKKHAKDISLYEPIGTDKEGNQISLFDILEEDSLDVVEQMEHQKDLQRLAGLLPTVLNPREHQIISLRFGLGRQSHITQQEVATKLGISRSYVSRIEKKAILKLRNAFMTEK